MKATRKQAIYEAAYQAVVRNAAEREKLTDEVSLEAYRHLTRQGSHGRLWTQALQTALKEHQKITIPAAEEVYWLDDTVVIPSDRIIEATGAVIRLVPEFPYIMLRNEHTHDGTHAPIDTGDRDRNITIHGGSWEEGCTKRGARRYSADTLDFKGVQTCMLFNNLDHLTMTDVHFEGATSFCVQVGDLTHGVFENFSFTDCYADGLHVNGNCENLYIRNFSGHVGDDLVALNMYDWLGSSINYGPARTVFCENIHCPEDSFIKAMRLQPGIFIYDDGTAIDCAIEDVYIRHLSGIFEYKLYLQTPPYRLGETPESGGVGSANNLFFEDVTVPFERRWYPAADRCIGMFHINSNIGYLSMEDIRATRPENDNPNNYLIAVGPLGHLNGQTEIFDPYASAAVDTLELANISINGEKIDNVDRIVKIVEFDDVNKDGFSSGKGKINQIILDGKPVTLNN